MNQRIKRLWIKALRSGKFKQAKGSLRVKDGEDYAYCCLGVLEQIRCEVESKRFPLPPMKGEVLTAATMKWAGLDSDNPNLPDVKHCAAGLNDDGRSFNFIADRIETYL